MSTLPTTIALVCPLCRADMQTVDENMLRCSACDKDYPKTDGFFDLIIGDRFDDDTDQECLCYEEVSNKFTVEEYWLPLFTKLKGSSDAPLKILALGCGTGVEVDILCDAGFDCVGIDCGDRTKAWENRKYPERLYLANGMNLPFVDGAFDIVFCGCVFPHIGVVGDSFITHDDFLDDRGNLAKDMARVTTVGGHILTSSPNGNCPFDLFHRGKQGTYKPRYNPMRSRFLLSLNDYKEIFEQHGFNDATPMQVENYWGFVRAKHNIKGLILGMPIRFVFWLVSLNAFRFLRTTPISPWIIVHLQR